jgi:guanylate kinase
MLSRGSENMIVLVGASASGKTELAKILYQQYNYKKCITTTTRSLRVNEKDGVDYHFISIHDFLKLVDEQAFLEVTMYQDNYYGIQRKDVLINGVVIVDPNGANAIYDKIGRDAYIVFVHSSEPLRQKRIIERKDDPNIILKRLKNDALIFNHQAFKNINLIIENEDNDLSDLAKLVHTSYQSYLSSLD